MGREMQMARPWPGKDDLFDRIGAFLDHQRLSPDPAHYHFAHTVLTNPDSAIGRAVTHMTDGGVRLTRQDIERLGFTVSMGAQAVVPPRTSVSA